MQQNKDLPTAQTIQAWLVAYLSDLLRVGAEEIDVCVPFESYGLSSRNAVSLSGELEDWLERRLEPTLAWEYPTIQSLAEHLAQGEAKAGERQKDEALKLQPAGDRGPQMAEPVAVVGIGCRFPGASGPDAFWQLLKDGIDAIGEVPPDRWDLERYYDPDPLLPGKVNTRWGGFIESVDRFDASFFGISPREATRMDPQQRLLLEVAWEALEDAGQSPDHLAGSATGVFVGISSNDYAQFQFADPALIDAYAGTGNAHSIAANRLSYLLDLHGPSLAVDTACSASLVAVHWACQSLRTGECDLAIAGGVNLILTPGITINFTKAQIMAPDGRSKAFDARANGYVRGEGAGMVVLKPLSRALIDGDSIYAVIRGSAVNHDGRSNGLMAPSPQAQEAVIWEACRRAGVSPGQIQYVEAHGTGTLLGDPIEAKALGAVVASDRPAGSTCALGSVKTNIGHLEAAAGVAGLIKVALSLKNREIPPSLHFREPNPHIPFDQLPLRVQQSLAPWPDAKGPALAGVSSFGFGGTNAHAILEEPPPAIDWSPPGPVGEERAHLLPLSARSPEALQSLARAYVGFFADDRAGSATSLHDICYSASLRRSHHAERLAAVGSSREEIVESLGAFLQGHAGPNTLSKQRVSGQRNKLVLVFPGQGSQWIGMGRELWAQEAVFRQALERCERAMRDAAHVDWSLLEELQADEERSRLDEIDIVQPALFAIQVALAALWRSWGIEADAVVGHSMGEVAAAHVAGALSLEDAVQVICQRSRLMKRVSGQGAMLAVGLARAEAQEILDGSDGRLSVAVCNSPRSTVLSGEPAALEQIAGTLDRRNVFCRFVKVDVAAHSPQMEPLCAELVQALEGVQPRPSSLAIYSTVTAETHDGMSFDASYWGRNLREPVLFATTVQRLAKDGYGTFLELSPHPILLGAIQQGLDHSGQEHALLPSLRREEGERSAMLGSLGALYTQGYAVDWNRLYPSGGRYVRLPTYPWQRQRYWLETEVQVKAKIKRPLAPTSDQASGPAPQRLDEWIYGLQWQRKEREVPEGSCQTGVGSWLVFADSGGIGETLAGLIQADSQRCNLVFAGAGYRRIDAHRFQISPERPDDMQRLLDATSGPEQADRRGVVHLWSLHTALVEEITGGAMRPALSSGCASVLHLLQTLDRAQWREPPRIWLVTQGAQSVGSGASAPLSLAQAPLWGLGRTLAQEHPDLWGGLLDLQLDSPIGDAAAQLWEEIRVPDREDQIGFREGRRYVARLVRRRATSEDTVPLQLRTDSTYLITGGLGDLGIQVAHWLVAQGARRLILLGRTELPPRSHWSELEDGHLASKVAAIRALEASGAAVHFAAIDVADEGQLGDFLQAFRREGWPPIRGVMHLAGVVEPQLLRTLEIAELERVLRPKLLGTWLLHRVLEDTPLDFFVLFSSAASLLSSPLLGSYAAANAFLDALAHYRRSLGLPALAINWGYWSQTGMAARYEREVGRELTPRGMTAFNPEQGLTALSHLLRQDTAQAAVMSVDWEEWSRFHPAASKSPLLSDLVTRGDGDSPAIMGIPTERGGAQTEAQPGRGTVLALTLNRKLLDSSPDELQGAVTTYIREQIARILHMETLSIPTDRNLVELGLDSLMAMELIRGVERDLQLRLYPREIFARPSVDALADYLADELKREHGVVQQATFLSPAGKKRSAAEAVAAWAHRTAPQPLARPVDRNPSVVFLLSGPRSGSTLLRVMLAGHRDLFSPPELHLLPFDTMQQRQEELSLTYLGEGLQRAFMELQGLDAGEGEAVVRDLTAQNLPIQQVYRHLQELAGERLLVDKSPSYGARAETLERAEILFEGPKYIQLIRHPYSTIESSVRIRIDRLLGVNDVDPYEFAEQIWATMNGNIMDSLQKVPPNRRLLIHFEDLVSEPARVAGDLCAFLGIPYDEALLSPYEGQRMTDGIHAVSMSTGDPNFLRHHRIEPALGEVWKEIRLPRPLGGFAQRVAADLGYELPQEWQAVRRSVRSEGHDETEVLGPARAVAPKDESAVVPISPLVPLQSRGAKLPLFLVHPASGLAYPYFALAQALGEDQPLYALQDPSLESSRPPHTRIEDYAEEYLQAIRTVQSKGPYLIGGWSFGGHVAFEMASRLHEAGQEVALLVAIDTEAPVAGRKLTFKQRCIYLKNRLVEGLVFAGNVAPYVYDGLYLLFSRGKSRGEHAPIEMSRWEYLQWAWSAAMYRLLGRRAGLAESTSQDTRLLRMRLPAVRRILYVLRCHLGVIRHFRPQPYSGRLTLLRADQQVVRQFYTDRTLGWDDLVKGGVEVHVVPGNHATLFLDPYVQAVARMLQKCVESAVSERGDGAIIPLSQGGRGQSL
jgi:acyl transferase domain-containing protein/thioesterase domain-containing protein/acyl carrier protein